MRALAAVALLVACSSEPPRPTVKRAAPATAAARPDDLWPLAPAGTRVAVVLTEPTLSTTLRAVGEVAGGLRGTPVAAQVTALFTRDGIDFLGDGPTRAGLDLSRGLARFETEGGWVLVYGVRDAAAFQATRGAEAHCRPHGAYVACASTAALLAQVGGDASAASAARQRPARLRGSVEGLLRGGATTISAAADVRTGGLDLRLRVDGDIPPVARTASDTPSPLVPRVLAAPVAGAVVVDGRNFVALARRGIDGSDPAQRYLRALRGDLAAVMLPGRGVDLWIALGVADVAAARDLVARCEPLPLPQVTLRRDGRACRVAIEPIPAAPQLELTVDGDALVLHTAGALTRRGTAPAPVAELLARPVLAAGWGRGFSYRALIGDLPIPDESRPLLALIDGIDEVAASAHVDDGDLEVALRIGTIGADPAAVVSAIRAALAPGRTPAQVAADLDQVAAAHPRSRTAASVALGALGPVMPAFVAGLLASSLVVPAFREHLPR